MRKYFLLYINNSTTNKTLKKCILAVVHIIKHNGDIHQLKILHSKLEKLPEKYENIKSTYCISLRKQI